MSKVFRYMLAYSMWIINLGLSGWLIYTSRIVVLALFASSDQVGEFQFTKTMNLVDRSLTVILGLGWLVFSIFAENYYRTGVANNNLMKRFARYTAPLLLSIFVIDLILFWMQIIGGDIWLRWLILAIELFSGLALFVFGRIPDTNKIEKETP